MNEAKLYFETLKEDRGRYFVEYRPPISGYRCATLQLIFCEPADPESTADLIEAEAILWLRRYPVAVMASAFNEVGSLISLMPVRACNHLLAFSRTSDDEPTLAWAPLPDADLPSQPLDPDFLIRTYRDVGYKTTAELRRESMKQAKAMRMGWVVVFTWLVVIPVAFAIAGFASPVIGGIALCYSLWRAVIKARGLLGKKSPRERARDAEELSIRHHHYHCERNPDGFLRLKLENFEAEEREQIRREAQALRAGTPRGRKVT